VIAAGLAELLDQIGGGSARLLLAATAVIRCDAGLAGTPEAGEQALDGARGYGELDGNGMGLSMGLPAVKKSAGEWGRARHVA
jgi:hypothetical protein